MFCSNCGTNIPDGQNFCPNCGTPAAAGTPANAAPEAIVPDAGAAVPAPDTVSTPVSIEKPGQTGGGQADYQQADWQQNDYQQADYQQNGGYQQADYQQVDGYQQPYQQNTYQQAGYQQSDYQQTGGYQQQGYQQTGGYQQQPYQQTGGYQQQPYQQTGYPASMGTGTNRNIALCIIFCFITCGIYGIYWFFKLNDEINSLAGEPDATSGIVVFLLSIVTCGIYLWYWLYQMGTRVDRIKQNRGVASESSHVLFLVLGIFGLGIVDYALMQSEINANVM